MNLKPKIFKKIETIISKYPKKRSAVLPLLHIIQENQGYISKEAMKWIAKKLEIQPINVYELVTFYPMFHQKPIGKKHVKICRTLSCALLGAKEICKTLQNKLNCPVGETSEDGNFTLELVECIASCHTAPVIQVNNVLYKNMTINKISEFAAQLKTT